ncbi:CspA family cold shock protein [Nocardioides ginsengisegetis]|uniref:CspA family cold shock protein n=1 Tax=Nocardioides ginsengisegetis TaxID=661491 RepID=A0A7W3PBS3_9ACTN|nr:cold shock domain-containing protein [Nocardioides ginsengisegetis]MBA8805767.1 CspA family cold shock protein [Nocardioides ginsengisegetis]
MSSQGQVREWHHDDGWGVIDSAETPGGCWAHFGVVRVRGYRTLDAGQDVEFTFQPVDQDGYAFSATAVWPAGGDPSPPEQESTEPSAAYRSSLRLEFDDDQAAD